MILTAAILANHSSRTCIEVSTWNHLGWLHGKTLHLLIILLDDAIKHTCIWPLAWRNKYKPYSSLTPHNFSPFHLPVKEKRKQGRMKDSPWRKGINLNQNNRSILVCQYSVLWEKTGPILLLLVGLTAERQAGRWNMNGFKFF